jgi:hypothetical protein
MLGDCCAQMVIEFEPSGRRQPAHMSEAAMTKRKSVAHVYVKDTGVLIAIGMIRALGEVEFVSRDKMRTLLRQNLPTADDEWPDILVEMNGQYLTSINKEVVELSPDEIKQWLAIREEAGRKIDPA